MCQIQWQLAPMFCTRRGAWEAAGVRVSWGRASTNFAVPSSLVKGSKKAPHAKPANGAPGLLKVGGAAEVAAVVVPTRGRGRAV